MTANWRTEIRLDWRDEIRPRCLASGRERWASARPVNTSSVQSDAAYETATCMDCGAVPVALVPKPTRLDSDRLVLAPHSPGGAP